MEHRGLLRLTAAVVSVAAGTAAVAGCSSGEPSRRPPPSSPAAAPGTRTSTPPGALPGSRPRPGPPAGRVRWGRPVLADGFAGRRLDPRRWRVYDAPNARSHPGSPAGVRVANGRLVLTGGLYGGRDESAGVVSRQAQTYGRWEARIRAGRGDGYAATAFLWPTRLGSPEWAEVDFAEIIDPTRQTAGLFVHHGRDDRQLRRIARADFTRWHTVAVDWLPSFLRFWVDGRAVWTYRGPFVPRSADMHLYLRNEVKDGFRRTARTPRRVTMQVDWVRVFRAPANAR